MAETLRQVITDALLPARSAIPGSASSPSPRVLVTNDLSHARVMVSVPGEDDATRPGRSRDSQSAAGFLRSRAARALTTRSVPELHFELDRGLEHAARINELLNDHSAGGSGLIGAVLVDKPAGMTSHDVVQRVRRSVGTRAAGHTGTLDPFATGLLVVLVGRATRLARFVEAQPKTYLATARLGVRTTTDDLTGAVAGDRGRGDAVTEARVREALAAFLGTAAAAAAAIFGQARGAASGAIGEARRGEPVELADVSVTVHWIELVEYRAARSRPSAPRSAREPTSAPSPAIWATGWASVRHLTSLRREAIGSLRVEDAVPLEQVSPARRAPAAPCPPRPAGGRARRAAREAVTHGRAVVDRGAAGQRGSGAGGAAGTVVSSLPWRGPTVDGSGPPSCC